MGNPTMWLEGEEASMFLNSRRPVTGRRVLTPPSWYKNLSVSLSLVSTLNF